MATKVNGLIQKVDPGNNTQYSIASTAYGYCETAAATAAKVVDMTGFTLLEGTTIHVKFKNNNTAASPTLNVNGTGAKPIVQYGTIAVSTSNATTGWYAGAVISFTYDGTSWVRDQGFNTDTNTTYTLAGLMGSPVIGSSTKPIYWNGSNFVTITSYEGKAATAGIADIAIKATQDGSGNNIVDTYATKTTINNLDFISPASSGSTLQFIDTISQTNGKISATKKQVQDASASQSGIVNTSAQTFAGDKTFNGSLTIQGKKAVRITSAPISGQVMIADGTDGLIKSSGYTIASSVPIDAKFTDIKVTQNNTTAANDYRILLSTSANDTAETNTVNKNTNLRYNPSTNTLSTGNISGTGNLNITGNANLNSETYAESITAGSLLVNGNTNFVQIPTAPTPDASSNDTSVATTAFVTSALTGVSSPMRFIGSLGTGGTATSLPAASVANQGYTYKVITANTYQGVAAKVGDVLVSNGSSWILIPSGDEPSGTVTSVTLKAGGGITLDTDNTAITTSGTRIISHKDTSSVTNLAANGRTYVTGLTFDTYGHVTGYTTGTETVTNTDTKVTSVGNHYTPIADNSAELTASLSGTASSYALNTEYTVLTGIKAQRDSKGHITGLTYTAQKIKDTNNTYTLAGLMGSIAIGSSTKPVYWNGSNFSAISSYEGKAATAGVADKLGTNTVGATNHPIYLNAGVPTAAKVGDAFISYGGQNFAGEYSPIDGLFNNKLRPNRFAGFKAAGTTIQYSNDGGSTWTDYGATDTQKVALFTTNTYLRMVPSGNVSANSQLRIIMDTGAGHVYTQLQKIMIYISTSYSQNCTVTIDAALESDPTNYSKVICTNQVISGWSGWNVINTNLTTYGNTPASQYGRIRFTFKHTGVTSGKEAQGLCVQSIYGYGGAGWTTPSTLATTDHVYSFDQNFNVTFPATVTATTFSGNASTATTLHTAHKINGTSFNGSTDITTANWGTARNINISDSDGTNTGTAVSVNGSAAVTLKLPATIKASLNGNASTATKLGTSNVGNTDRPIYLSGGTATQTTYRMAGTNTTATTARAITENLESGNWYVNGTNSTDLYSQSDGVAYVEKYNDNWIHEIYGDYHTGQIAVRGKNNGTWQAWRKVLDSSNYTSYTVKKDGTGASGNWGINITGSSASCTGNAATATSATKDSSGAVIKDTYVKKTGDTISGVLYFNSGSTSDGNTLGHGLSIWHDGEGGNIRIYSGNASTYGSYYWENDAFNGDLRWYNIDSTGTCKGEVRIQKDNVVLFGAAWNDYAEMRNVPEANDYGINGQQSKLAGYCVCEVGDDTMTLTTKRLQRGCKIISDTFGFNIGETEDCKTPIAVSGRALVYLYEDRELARQYIGWPVCSGPDGTVSIMTEEEEEKYPSRIVGTISAIPDYEEWGTGKVKVNGRIWIYVR